MKRIRLVVVFLMLMTLMVGCGNSDSVEDSEAASYKQITQEEAARMMQEESDYIILDVRTQEEYAEGHIPGAICVPNETIIADQPEVLPDYDQMIFVYCRTGRRSKEASQKLASMGYTNIYEFGGITTWTGEIVSDTDQDSSTEGTSDEQSQGTESEVADDSTDGLPPYQYFGDDKIEAAIAAFMANTGSDGYYAEEGSVAIPAPVIFQSETMGDGRVKVYGNFWVFTYVPDGNTLSCISGGEALGIIYLEKSGDDYLVCDAEFAGDGSQYAEDIKRFCNGNKSLEDQYFSSNDAGKNPVRSIRIKYIFDYLAGNGLDQKYDSYQDYGWDPVYLSEATNWANPE